MIKYKEFYDKKKFYQYEVPWLEVKKENIRRNLVNWKKAKKTINRQFELFTGHRDLKKEDK